MLTSGPLPGQNFLVKKENNIEFFLQEKSMSMLGSNPDQNIVIYEVKHVCSVCAQCHACMHIVNHNLCFVELLPSLVPYRHAFPKYC